MFKLIGIIVVVAVLTIGFPALQRWYSGDATPRETVKQISDSVGQKLITEDKSRAKPTTSGRDAAPAAEPSNESHAERVLRELNQKK
jgi:hypothetical protein